MDLDKRIDSARPYVLSLYRIVVGMLFACHGASTVLGMFGGPEGGQPHAGAWPSWWAGLIQLVCGTLVCAGSGDRGTRAAAVIGSGAMAYAYFTVHQKRALWPIENGGEAAAMFCWSLLLIAAVGPGAWQLARARLPHRSPSPDPDRAPEAA